MNSLLLFFIFLYHILLYLKQPFFFPSLISPPLLSYVYPLLFVCPFQFYSAFFSHSCSFVKTTDVWKTNTKKQKCDFCVWVVWRIPTHVFPSSALALFFSPTPTIFFLFKDLISWLRHKNKQTKRFESKLNCHHYSLTDTLLFSFFLFLVGSGAREGMTERKRKGSS